LKNKTIGFVPTMGAIHEGHISLLKKSKENNNITVLSIFVNSIQFEINGDFSKYPRTFENDLKLAKKIGVDIIFHPGEKEIYPIEQKVFVEPSLSLTQKLCAATRPTHFRGVATIVAKLFNIIKPTVAYFGQKDYQQFLVLKSMVEQLNFDIRLEMRPIIREKDGLAMSSRNRYLNDIERKYAISLSKALEKANEIFLNISKKDIDIYKVKKEMIDIIEKDKKIEKKIDYIFIGNADNLVEFEKTEDLFKELKKIKKDLNILVAVAAYIGTTRLIDNKIIKFD
jgi:pantoate--beta-alanine ligase